MYVCPWREQVEDEKRWLEASHAAVSRHMSSYALPLDEWTWALDIVRSRTFKVGSKYVMCPLMDMCNHASQGKSETPNPTP